MWNDKSSIQAKFLNKMIIIVFVSIGLWCLIWIHDEYSTFKAESDSLREEYIRSQKIILKKEVASVVRYINDIRIQSEQKLEVALKERVYQAHQIAMNIYQQNADSKALPEIQKMIKDALRNIRFNGGRGYYFAGSMDGVDHLYPVRPEIEGTNLIDLQDLRGNFAIRDEIQVVKTKNEGFVKHFWPKPGKDPSQSYPKISFVKHFKPLNWYLGTGEYLDDANEQIQNEVLTRIVSLRFQTEGYFFGSTYQGDPLFSSGKITTGSASVWNLTDPDGVKIIQEQRKAVESSEGGFVSYTWEKLNTSVPSPKISFVQGISEWEWTIGAGIYLDTIEKTISENKALLIAGLKKRITRSLLVLVILLCLIYLWSRRISIQIRKSVNSFSSFLSKSSIDSTPINPDIIELKEFREIAISTNKMLADRKQAQEDLIESENLFSLFMDYLPAMVFIKDEKSKTLFVNKHMNDVLGAKEWIGKTSFDLFPKDLAEAMIADDKKTFAEGYQSVIEKVPDKFGINHIYQTYKFKINRSEKPPLLGGIALNITKNKEAEAEKLNAQKIATEQGKHAMVGQIAGKIAHDFNNILGIIMGNTELSLIDCKDMTTKKTLELIFEQTIRGKNLTKNLIAFAKDHEPKQVFFRISEKIDLVLTLMRKDLEGIDLVKEESRGVPELLADPGMIEHAIVNLIQNAIHALSLTKNPRIIIRTYSRDSQIYFEIEDNGCGIPKENLEDIYGPSFTLKGNKDVTGAYKTNIKGTGYGMSNVKKYIHQHKGTILVASDLGVGTKFTIGLPVIRKELTHEEKTKIRNEKAYFEKYILLVEDETAISNIQYSVLTQAPCNHKVDIANNGQVAIDLFERNKYDFVSLDYILSGDINGMDIYNHIRSINKTIPILFISGNIEFLESINQLKQKDTNVDHLSKPCQNIDYVNSINGLFKAAGV